MMRRLFIAVVLFLLLVSPAIAADDPLRLEGIAYTEGDAKEIQIQVWALGEQVAEHPEWQFEAVFAGVVSSGKAFSVDLGEARLPVLVELEAENHCAVSLEVMFPEQLELPAAWLREGNPIRISISSKTKLNEDAVVWGEVSSDSLSRDPRNWKTAIAHLRVAPGTSFEAVVPTTAGGGEVRGIHPLGHFGKEQFRVVAHRTTVRLDLTTSEIPVKVWDHRGRPVAGMRVVEAGSPFETAMSTDEEGRTTVNVPRDGQWKIVALNDEWMGSATGRGSPDGDLAVDVVPRTNVALTWEESTGSLAIEPNWMPRSLGGRSRIHVGGQSSLPKLEEQGWCAYWSPAVAWGSARFDGPAETVVLKARSPVRVVGRVITAGGEPAPGLPVWIRLDRTAYSSYGRMMGSRGGEQPLYRPWLPWAVSGPDGGFSVTGLPPSDLQAEALAPGLPTARGERLTGKEGQALETTVVLRPGASLALRVTDPDGAPLEGVTAGVTRSETRRRGDAVRIVVARTRDRGDPELTGSTDAEGRAELTQVPVGTIRLQLDRPGFVTRTFDRIEVPAEGTDLGDLYLEPGVTLRGKTVGPDGETVANAEVAIGTDPRMPYFRAETTSGDEGSFSIPDLSAVGTVYLQARTEGFVPESPVAVEMPPEAEVEVAMAVERKLEGVVLDTRDDAPVAGADVSLAALISINPAARVFSTPTRAGRATSGSDGRFVIDGLTGGSRLELSATASGLQRGRMEVVVPAEADPEPVVLRLEPGLELRGRVLTENGEPAPGLSVMATPASQTFDDAFSMRHSRTMTRSDGSFRFDDLSQGQVVVQARSEDGRLARENAKPGQSEEVILRFEPGLTIVGVVLDPENVPVRGAQVGAWGECAQNYVRYETSADGKFELTNVKTGTCTVTVSAEEYARESREIEVPEGGLSHLELRLERGATVVGQIRGVASAELEGCFIHSDDGATTEPGMDGSFRLSGVGSGERQITARLSTSERSRSVTATVPESGETGPVIIDFESGLTISGRVLRGGEGVPGVVVTANGVGNSFAASGLSVTGGAWRIEGLEPGEYQIAAQNRSGDVVAGDHVILETDTELDLQIAGGTLMGRVVDAETQQPIEGAKVTVSGSGLPPIDRKLLSGPGGHFEVVDVPDGDFVVRAEAAEHSPVQKVVSVHDGMAGDVVLPLGPKTTSVLVVRRPDGTFPSSVWIITASGGVLGPDLSVACSAGGRCVIDAIPLGRWTLVVFAERSAMALLVADLPQDEIPVTMRPTGKLRIIPPSGDASAVWQVRLIEAATGIVMPFNQWHSPSRTGWMSVHVTGQTVGLPEGTWRIEVFAPDGTQGVQEATVTAGGTAEVVLE